MCGCFDVYCSLASGSTRLCRAWKGRRGGVLGVG